MYKITDENFEESPLKKSLKKKNTSEELTKKRKKKEIAKTLNFSIPPIDFSKLKQFFSLSSDSCTNYNTHTLKTSLLIHFLLKNVKILILYEIFFKLLSKEESSPKEFLKNHEINYKLRAKMLDWLIEIIGSYKLQSKTFFLAVCLMDRFF